MHRCLQLALLGAGHVAPNPMVGAVLVYEGMIIGEGYHQQYGMAHAEVNCINSVQAQHQSLIEKSTLYVSLEPCAHFGKTPPCADLIIRHKIPEVVVGCRDSFAEVNGRGIEKMQTAGIRVMAGVLEDECRRLNQRFFTFHEKRRPCIILKWAQSNNAQIANADYSRVLISNDITNRLVHRWRSEEAAIMVGSNTAVYDNPSLTNRLWKGNQPIRILLDRSLRVPATHQLLSDGNKTVVFNQHQSGEAGNIIFRQLNQDNDQLEQIMAYLYEMKVQSVLIEGGAKLLQLFIDRQLWDEARVITANEMVINNGIAAPILTNAVITAQERILNDTIYYYTKTATAR